MAAASALWYARREVDGSGTLTCISSPDFPDGTMVDQDQLSVRDLSALPSLWLARYQPGSGRLLEVIVTSGAGWLWYAEVPEPDADPPAVTLVAYDTRHFTPGTVVDNGTFESIEIRSDDRVGAIRWWPGTGQIHQIYVDPRRRRQGVATALIYAASAHLLAGGSSARIWACAHRTDLGEPLAQGPPHQQRVRDRQSVPFPMTSPDAAAGVRTRDSFPEP